MSKRPNMENGTPATSTGRKRRLDMGPLGNTLKPLVLVSFVQLSMSYSQRFIHSVLFTAFYSFTRLNSLIIFTC